MLTKYFAIVCISFLLFAAVCESKLLMFDDFERGKLNKEHWTHGAQALKIDWKIKGGEIGNLAYRCRLELFRIWESPF